MITAHPLREALHNEVHARPYERMTAPLVLTHIAVLPTADGATRAHLDALLRARLLPLPAPDASHLSIELGGGLRLRWERHTDFRLHADGHARLILAAPGEVSPRRLGRTVQRVLEIETYRMSALLGLPVAREVGGALVHAESDLARIAGEIRSAQQQTEPELLRHLTELAGEVESLYARTHARFSASAAYFELLQRRISELHEKRIHGLQTLGEFMDRRLAPAMQTCAWAARRQQALSERISRTSNLLRTRVEIEQQQSSQALLDAMNRRQEAQLLLQSAVEGLSVAAITYYGAGLVGYIAKGLREAGVNLQPELVVAISIPLIAFGVWRGIRRLHNRVMATVH